jgi:hypothetical protein
MADRNFFFELKRRNVYKVAVACIIADWGPERQAGATE